MNGEPLIDQTRLLADNILSVFIQENSPATGVVGTPLHVFDFAVNVAPANSNSVSLNFVGYDSVIAFNASAGHTYQLQSASILAPQSWTNLGPVVNGIDGMMAIPDPNARQSAQRFYRVITDPAL